MEHRQAAPELWSRLEVVEPPPVLPPHTEKLVIQLTGKESSAAEGNLLTVINYYALKDYLRCPSRYFYKHTLKGQSNRDENKSRFYDGLRQTRRELDQARLEGAALPSLETVLEQYHGLWPSKSVLDPPGEPAAEPGLPSEPTELLEVTAADYQRHRGAAVVEQIWQHYQAKSGLEQDQPVSIEYNRLCRVTLSRSVITFHIDRVETLGDGSLRLVKTLVRRPYKTEDELGTDDYYLPTLYALAFPAQPGRPPNQVVLETTNRLGVQQLVLSKAYKKAVDYRRWQAGQIKSIGLLGKLEAGFQALQAGDFSPKPDHHCPGCPFYTVICPLMPV
jgi:hypothetical protein